MDIAYFYGPDRAPLLLASDGSVSDGAEVPFHGIASRGLLPWIEQQSDGAELWERLAHRLHDGTHPEDEKLGDLRGAARRMTVLSLAQSAEAAGRYVRAHCARDLDADISAGELWNIKEGHTSSVWVATLTPEPWAAGHRFVVNVSRDALAARELRTTSERMRVVGERCPDLPIAAVLDISRIAVDAEGGEIAVTVTRNEFVANALEVHRLVGATGREDRYALVERFITSDDAPAHIRALRGRMASGQQQETIDEAIRRLLAAGTPTVPMALDINDGDVVWDGQRAVVVAIGAPDVSWG
jgi:hypothetical protein